MRGILGRCAVLLTSTALIGAMAGVAPAQADEFSRLGGNPVGGADLVLADGEVAETALFSLRLSGEGSVGAYAASPSEELRPRTAYVEAAWSDVPQWTETGDDPAPADRANWIVTNSYPAVDLPDLAEDAGRVNLAEDQAIAGTQAALWHVLEGTEPDTEANGEAVAAVYEHLVEGSAGTEEDSPDRSLEVAPAQLEVSAPEEPLGPLAVSGSGSEPATVSVRGAPESWLVDADGEQVTRVLDGDELYLEVDPSVPEGVVTLHVRGDDVPISEGQLFTGRDGVRTQPLVTAEPGTATSLTTTTITWHSQEPEETEAAEEPEPEPEPEPPEEDEPSPEVAETDAQTAEEVDRNSGESLASTGTWLSGLLIIAGALAVSGLVFLLLGRKRRS